MKKHIKPLKKVLKKSIRGKYSPLANYLRTIPPEIPQLTLKFYEIEKIISANLPKAARTYREYWANTYDANRLILVARKAGWEVEDVFLRGEIVIFEGEEPILYQECRNI